MTFGIAAQLLTSLSARRTVSSRCRLQLLATASAQQSAVLRLIRNVIRLRQLYVYFTIGIYGS